MRINELFQPATTDAILLLKAADLVRQRGLAKGIQQDDDGSVCIQGAFSITLHGEPYQGTESLCRHVRSYLRSQGLGVKDGVEPRGGLAFWNNKPERTAEDVINVLEATATELVEGVKR